MRIYYFSGTGNTGWCAKRLAALLGAEVVCLDAQWLRNPSLHPLQADSAVFMFPVYSWGIPPVVQNWLQNVPIPEGMPAWLVVTCGDDCGLTADMWTALMQHRGLRPMGQWSVQMPNTYVTMSGFDVDPKDVEEQKILNAETQLPHIAQAIQQGTDTANHTVRGSWAWVKSRIILPWFNRFATSPRKFHYTNACIGCKRCARQCPMDNITHDTERRPHWGNHCAFCLGCYHACPVHAVAYGRTTRHKGQKPIL